jgi:hypothetical protein
MFSLVVGSAAATFAVTSCFFFLRSPNMLVSGRCRRGHQASVRKEGTILDAARMQAPDQRAVRCSAR